jgi:hypothetical protein
MDSQGGQTNPTVDIPRYLDLYREGKLKLNTIITHKYPLSQINTALDTVRSGRTGRCVVEMVSENAERPLSTTNIASLRSLKNAKKRIEKEPV